MAKHRVTATAQVEVVTMVEAEDWQEAEQIAQDREVDICIHGSEFTGNESNEEFILVDGSYYKVDNISAEKVE